jgi:hypothetical protein
MVAIAKTIVDEDAVVIKLLHASLAEIAVICILRPQSLTVHTDII